VHNDVIVKSFINVVYIQHFEGVDFLIILLYNLVVVQLVSVVEQQQNTTCKLA